jgi:hypothetical protein
MGRNKINNSISFLSNSARLIRVFPKIKSAMMIKIWFLMALMSYPNVPAIAYKGFGGYLEKEECEKMRITAENIVANYEISRGNTVYIKTFCMEMDAFESQLKLKEELEKLKNKGEDA